MYRAFPKIPRPREPKKKSSRTSVYRAFPKIPRECEMIGDKDSIRAPTKLFQIELKLLSAGVFQRLLKLYKVANPKKNRAGLRYTERFQKSQKKIEPDFGIPSISKNPLLVLGGRPRPRFLVRSPTLATLPRSSRTCPHPCRGGPASRPRPRFLVTWPAVVT